MAQRHTNTARNDEFPEPARRLEVNRIYANFQIHSGWRILSSAPSDRAYQDSTIELSPYSQYCNMQLVPTIHSVASVTAG